MFIKKGKTNWIYVAILFMSAAVMGMYLISYINGGEAQNVDANYSQLNK